MAGTGVESLRQALTYSAPPHGPLRAGEISGPDLRIGGVYAPFSSSKTTFESMVSAAQRAALGTRF